MTTQQDVKDAGRITANALVEWYWKFGTQRESSNAVSLGWLRNAYTERDLLDAIASGQCHPQASLGIWGPSQSGKSTMISQFVDESSDSQGRGGLLDWGQPTLFSSRARKDDEPELPSETIVFNPHNMGSDASGCVSRFTLVADDQIAYADYPVEIRLLSDVQVMHAISAGFQSECKGGNVWTVEAVETLLESYSRSAENKRPDRGAFELLHDVLNVLELLVEARDDRFTQLNAEGRWNALASKIADNAVLVSDKRSVFEFAAKVLWGGQPVLTSLFNRLVAARNSLPKGRLYCSLEIAATLVNIDSFKIHMQPNDDGKLTEGARKIRNVIRNLSWQARGTDITIGRMAGSKLLASDADFGFFQGLVRELVIPLRKANAKSSNASFQKFMERSELVDFPGLPNRDKNAHEAMIDLDSVENENDTRLLTDILKRGKVLSLVNGYSRTLSLDSFVILARAGKFVPKVEQLHRGLTAWWRFVDPTFDPYSSRNRKPPLPMFFNLTFFAEIVDKVVDGAASTGLLGMAEQISQLNPFALPNLSTLIVTTYPQFKDGRIHAGNLAATDAVNAILADSNFGPYCNQDVSQQSLKQMITAKDGGVGFLFDVLSRNASSDERLRLLNNRQHVAVSNLIELIEEHIPQEGNAQRKRDLELLRKAISKSLSEKMKDPAVDDAASWVSYRLRKFLDVDPKDLERVPPPDQPVQKYVDYINKQVSRWIESKSRFEGLVDLGIRDNGLRTRLLEFLSERIRREELASWLRTQLPRDRKQEDNDELRRMVAISMSNHLLHNPNRASKHPSLDGTNGVINVIREWAKREEVKAINGEKDSAEALRSSPHFTAVIAPMAKLFDEMAKGDRTGRSPQPGDEEALKLLEEAKQCLV